jgi:hypothetical protein
MKKIMGILASALLLVLAACNQSAPEVTELESQKLSSTARDYGSDVVANLDHVYVLGSTEGRVVGSTSGGVFLRQYTVTGKPVWTRQFAGAGRYGSDLALAPNGDVYVLANSVDETTTKRMLLRKYSKAGTLLWSEGFGNTVVDGGAGVDLELRGSVLYALANKNRAGGFLVYRFNTSGTALSTITKNDATVTQAIDLTFDKRGNMLVATKTGYIESNSAGIKVLRYAPTGQANGAISVDTNRNDLVKKLVVDSKNNLYIAWEQLYDTINIAKYDTSFRSIGNTVIASPPAGFSATYAINDMAIASNDGIVIAGTTTSGFGDYVNRGGYDAFVLGIDTAGTTVRVNFGSEVQFGTSKDDFGYGVAVSSKTFIVGSTEGNFKTPNQAAFGGSDAFVAANRFEWLDQ